jgi:hypothetical protein
MLYQNLFKYRIGNFTCAYKFSMERIIKRRWIVHSQNITSIKILPRVNILTQLKSFAVIVLGYCSKKYFL